MASVRPLTDLTVADLWREVKDEQTLWGDVSRQTLRSVKLLLENRMLDELTQYLNAGRYVRDHGRAGYRNGVYHRRLTTTWGTIPDLRIPRPRATGFRPTVVARYQQRTEQVNRLVRAVFLGGLSTRRVGAALAPLLGDTVSPATVSTITQTLDHAVAAFHGDWEALLAFYTVAHHDWRRVRTTNAIERAFREVRRRTRPMSCFTNTASCDRIMFAVIWAFNQHAAGRPLSWETTQKS